MLPLTTPLNWQRVRLGDIAHIFDGTHQTPQYTHYGVAFFSVENIVSDKPSKFISQQDYLTATNQNRPEYNDILLTRIGTIGVSKVVNWNYPFSIYVTLAVIKQSKYFNSYYLHYFIQSNFFQKELKNNSLLQAIPSKINMNELKKCEVILPPLNEQIAIANILSGLDRYLCALDALILKKEGVKKALSFELLSQRKRLRGFNQAWQRVRLGDICEIVKGQQINKISLNNTDKYPVINGGIDFLGYTNKFNVSKNTIAISEGGTCGYVRFMTSNFWSGGHNYSLQKISNKVNNLCLYHILKSYEKDIMKLGVGSGLKNIQLKALKDFEILLPPLNEQIAIANILSALDNEIISLKNKKRQFENIKKALNHDLMSAKIRVLEK
ncbi:restriction endonuclease subunit S [Helicobacter pylori]|uniref:restriction endonuclease subunit S n=1 Tax=Helicobacter pylori TaxID=210 RepID=UPI001495691C|nr:restriction endonuclease subunit S [Helicobacter pylori]NPS34810.1 restriction endonuclease subunit S [Helicobacter pylori]